MVNRNGANSTGMGAWTMIYIIFTSLIMIMQFAAGILLITIAEGDSSFILFGIIYIIFSIVGIVITFSLLSKTDSSVKYNCLYLKYWSNTILGLLIICLLVLLSSMKGLYGLGIAILTFVFVVPAFILCIIWRFIWIAYFKKSERVKSIFIN